MIRQGDITYIPELKRLWKTCFEDEDAYIDAFFQALYKQEQVLLAEENGMLMGASFFLPGKIYVNGTWQDIRYIYALAVHPQFRGRGTAGRLLKHAYDSWQVPLLAEPAEDGLVNGFYGPLGFEQAFYLAHTKINVNMRQYAMQAAQIPVSGQSRHIFQVEAGRYSKIRRRRFCREGYVDWPVQHTAFALQEHRAAGGGALCAVFDGKEYEKEDILLYYIEDSQAVVTETTLAPKEAGEVLAAWLEEPVSSLIVKTAAGQAQGLQAASVDADSHICLTGMSYGLCCTSGYLNLTLD